MFELNPFLTPDPEPGKGGTNFIEQPDAVRNIVFQTRGQDLSAYEAGLAGALMRAFEAGCTELEQLVAALDAGGSKDESGAAWTVDSLAGQLARSARLFAVGGTQA